ncbi:SpaA isopeptide-forming pilin-related protein [Anaerococcus cruorum]|uniref:SpaA isopeptide-forming pilin-related protein n=1 Tax=Anaerococcus sp. WGS1596 TaxID=3366806 RepID=UPI00372D3479
MKNKLQQFIVKLLAATLAIILAVPTNVFAMKQSKSNIYTAATSVMGVQEKDTSKEETENTDSSLIKSAVSQEETTDYIIEKSATLSKTTGQVDYKIVVKTKDPSKEFTENQITTFGITENTDDEKLSVDDVKVLDADGNETDIKFDQHTPNLLNAKEDIRTTGITSAKPQYGMVYYLSTKLTEEALKNLEEKSPQLALDFTIASPNQNPVQTRYSLETTNPDTTEITIDNDNNVVNQAAELVEKEDNLHLYKGEYKKEEKTLFQTTPAHLVWTDYINAKDDKEFAIDFDLDENQDTENSQIKIDYYEASDKGYVLNQSFSKTVDFTNSLNLTIPQGYIAKLEVITKPKENTNAKEYEFNGIKIQNPSYTEETSQAGEEEKPSEDDADPLPADTSKEENSKTKEEDERQKTEESGKNAQSAIALNKDAYISDLKENNKLSTNLENATKQIVPVLESYNKEEINWDDFKASIQNIAKAENIDSAQAEEIISALLRGLNEDKYKVANVDIKEATNFDQASENALTTEEIKALIKEEFAKKDAGQITEEELEASLASIREKNNITNEDFVNILRDLYKNDEIANDSQEDTTTIKTDKTKEKALAEKLAEENLSTEDFITFLQSYVKSYDIKEDQLESLLKDKQAEVEKVIGDFTIDEIVAAAYLEGLNPHIFAEDNPTVIEADFDDVDFKTELEYYTETLTRATNEQKLFDIVRKTQPGLKDHAIRNDYVGWKINIPGTDDSGNDITEFKKDKYEYDNLNFSIYAPAGQSLEDYKVVVEDGQDGTTDYSGSMTEKKGEHYIYSFSIPKNKLTEKGYNIYVVAKEPKKRQNYAIGVKISPDKNYVNELVKDFDKDFEELSQKYPFLIKWKDTSAANPYRNGINLIDTRMVYLEPKGWQDLFPYNGFRSLDYNDNIDDTDIMKNRVSMFGNIKEDGQITWTISETFPAERLVNKNTVGIDAYSAKTDGQGLTGPSVQILVPNDNGGYDVTDLGNVAKETLQEKIGNKPGTIVNYTFTDKATNKEEFTTLSLDSGKSASIAYKPSLLQREEGAEKDTSGLAYLHKVQEHKDGSGYEVALSKDQANTMKAFIPSNPNANPRYNDPAFTKTGVIVFCLNPGKPEPTRQYKFNGTITKGEWSTAEKDWATNGRAIAALATANEAKSSPLYKGTVNEEYYASLYEYVLRLYWYGQELAEEYQLDEQSYYKIIQYNLYYWLAGENYAESFRNGGGYNPNYFSSAEYSYAQGLKNRIAEGKDWGKVNKDEEIQFFYYGHDKTRSYQNTITGDTKKTAKKGSVTVNKIDQDQDGKKLPGAYFQLLDKNKDPIKTLVTDENGVAVFEDLDYGTYYIKEVQGPKGYQFKEEISDAIVVGKEQAHYTFNYKNKKNEIEFRKVNEKGLAMDGVVFELSLNGRALSGQDQISGKDGKFSWKELTPGNYQVVEKDISKYPEYSENEGRTVASFRVDENNIIQDKKIYYPNGNSKIDIKNEKNEGKPIGIEFTKVDLKTENPLEGAEFVLEYRKPDSSIFRELPGSRTRSNSQGKLVWNDLVDGDYRVIETKAPDGNYDTDLNLGEKATFTIVKNQNGYYEIKDKDQLDLKITNTAKPEEPKITTSEFEFTKEDKETKDKLQGVEFTLTSEGEVGEKGKEFDYKVSKTTDENGKIKFETLYPGTYTLKETKQLPGYQENKKTWTVVVDDQGETKVQSQGGGYKIETSKEQTFDNTYVSLKASIKETNNEGVFLYTMKIKPKKDIYGISLQPNSSDITGDLTRQGTIDITGLEVGKEKTFSRTFSIRDIDKINKNTDIYPVNQVMILKDGGGNQQTASISPTFKVIEDSGPLTITNEKEKPKSANLTIRKYDKDTNLGLEGAEFELYDNASATGKPIDKATSNEHGYATFNSENIQLDTTYYVKEVKAPEGYKFTSAITKVTSSAQSDNTINAEIPNEKNNSRFELYKKDSNGNYLEGAKFRLLDENQNKFEPDRIETTDSNGYIKFDNLKAGKTYYLEEVEAPDGYRKKEGKLKLIVDKDGYISWKNESLVEEADSAEPSKIITNDVLKVEKNAKSESYNYEFANNPNYMNARDYVEATDPENSLITYYLMLKPNFVDGSSATNKPTMLGLNATNANLEKVELFDVNPGRNSKEISVVNEKLYIGGLMNSKSIDDRVISYLDRTQAQNSDAGNITMGSSTISEKTTNIIENNQTNNAFIKFPHNGSEGRFDGNWSYIVKVTAKIVDKYQKSQIGYNWKTIDTPNNNDAILHHFDLPALYEKEVITEENEDKNTEAPSFTVINQKKPSIDFVKQDGASKNPLYGAEFVLYKGDEEVKDSLTSSDRDGKFGFDNLEDGSYTVYETVPPEGYPYAERFIVSTFTVENGKVKDLKTNQKYGEEIIENFDSNEAYPIYNKVNEIKFKKVGKDNKPLAGAKFKLDRVWDSYDDKGDLQPNRQTVLENIETLDDGIIALSATEPGRYQLVETYAPKGYQQIKTDNDEEVKIGGQIVAEFTVERGSLDIKNVLVGDKYIQDMTGKTDPLEIVNKEVGEGKFQVNKVKKDGNTTNPLTGAKFLLKDMESDQYVNTDGTLTTNSGSALTSGDATVNYENLTAGKYELREFKSPDGYVRTINTWNIVVAKDGKTTIIENEKLDNDVTAEITPEATSSPAILKLVNKSNEIEFTKIDSKIDKALAGVEFEVWWDQQGNIENRYEDTEESQYKNYVKIKNPDGGATFTTDSKGKFKLSNLKTGHYKIYETLPKGYKVTDQPTDNEPIAKATGEFVNEFYVDMDGDIKKNDNGIVGGDKEEPITTIKNTPITGKFRVQKVGEDGVEKLDGAEFALYKVIAGQADKEKYIKQEVVKDSDDNKIPGRIEFADLKDGQYLLEETKAPDGYVMSATKWEVTVEDGRVNISSTDESSSFTRTDDTLTLNVVNKKASYPSTGGNGPKIAFAILGTATMLAAIAYYAIYQKDKNKVLP